MADDVKAHITKAVLFNSRDAEGVDLLLPFAPGKRVKRWPDVRIKRWPGARIGLPLWVTEDIAPPRRAAPEPRRSL